MRLIELIRDRFLALAIDDIVKLVEIARRNPPDVVPLGITTVSSSARQFLPEGYLLPEVKEWILRYVKGDGLEMIIECPGQDL